MRTRRNVWELPAGDQTLEWYGKAVAKMATLPQTDPFSWQFQGRIHGIPNTNPTGFWAQCQHGTAFFPPWHRMYLLNFERIVAKHVASLGGPADWALPYWNYSPTDPAKAYWQTLPKAFRSPTLPSKAPNPLYVAQRSKAANSGQNPFSAGDTSLGSALKAGSGMTSTSFFGMPAPSHYAGTSHVGGKLEATVHNNVHGALGYDPTSGMQGWMGNPDLAALDPIFWLHHANIDRLWVVWLDRNKALHKNPTQPYWLNGVAFPFKNAAGADVNMRSAEVLSTTDPALDYQYDDVSDPIVAMPVGPAMVPIVIGALGVQELVGASTSPIVLSDAIESVDVPTPVAAQAMAAAVASIAAVGGGGGGPVAGGRPRVTLQIENMKSTAHSPTYDIYINTPPGADPAQHADRFVERMTLFGVPQSGDPAHPHGGSGQTFAFDISALYHRLDQSGQIDPKHLHVFFVPVRSTHGAPVHVGRISLYFE